MGQVVQHQDCQIQHQTSHNQYGANQRYPLSQFANNKDYMDVDSENSNVNSSSDYNSQQHHSEVR